jgi:hypothetical protein
MFENDFESPLKKTSRHPDLINENVLVCEIYSVIRDFEEHLDQISSKYKMLSLTCFLAVCLAIGFIFSTEAQISINHFTVTILLSTIGFGGITLLWHLDINVYQKFLAATIIEEIAMENKYPFLLKLGKMSFLSGSHRNYIFSQNLAYMIYNCIFLFHICLCSLSFHSFSLLNLLIAIVLASLSMFLNCFFMHLTGRRLQHGILLLARKRGKNR